MLLKYCHNFHNGFDRSKWFSVSCVKYVFYFKLTLGSASSVNYFKIPMLTEEPLVLKKKAVCFSETFVSAHKFTWQYNPEYQYRHFHQHDNFISYIILKYFYICHRRNKNLPKQQASDFDLQTSNKWYAISLATFLSEKFSHKLTKNYNPFIQRSVWYDILTYFIQRNYSLFPFVKLERMNWKWICKRHVYEVLILPIIRLPFLFLYIRIHSARCAETLHLCVLHWLLWLT